MNWISDDVIRVLEGEGWEFEYAVHDGTTYPAAIWLPLTLDVQMMLNIWNTLNDAALNGFDGLFRIKEGKKEKTGFVLVSIPWEW